MRVGMVCPRAIVAVEPDYCYSRCFRAILAGRQATEVHTRIRQTLPRLRDSPCDVFTAEGGRFTMAGGLSLWLA
jgi:hypothetical protein